ncbi:sulfotransferase 1C2-like [Protopterus annectens]|uniref:sulfotransferase 1C2-like n=1 Tax=Protopterus annectens TaxID=7888 RepID=UPI001CFB440C|nr:sulfotransferase 1C2-like [Protopterus annectens]
MPNEDKMECPANVVKRCKLAILDGVPLMDMMQKNWEQVKLFQALPNDLLVASYPKAGTTWLLETVDMILNDGDIEKCQRAPIYDRIPFLEEAGSASFPTGLEQIAKMTPPRIIKTHLPFHVVPKSFWEQGCKAIYIARNMKDNLVSYYHFHRMCREMPEPGTWEEFFMKFLNGEVVWGSWDEHVIGWWEERSSHRILYLFYEDMKEDPKREIIKVMQFLGKELPERIMDKIIHHTSFDVMKENPMTNHSTLPNCILDNSVSSFMRKGIVGDWKNHLTVAQNEVCDKQYSSKMADSTLQFRFIL